MFRVLMLRRFAYCQFDIDGRYLTSWRTQKVWQVSLCFAPCASMQTISALYSSPQHQPWRSSTTTCSFLTAPVTVRARVEGVATSARSKKTYERGDLVRPSAWRPYSSVRYIGAALQSDSIIRSPRFNQDTSLQEPRSAGTKKHLQHKTTPFIKANPNKDHFCVGTKVDLIMESNSSAFVFSTLEYIVA